MLVMEMNTGAGASTGGFTDACHNRIRLPSLRCVLDKALAAVYHLMPNTCKATCAAMLQCGAHVGGVGEQCSNDACMLAAVAVKTAGAFSTPTCQALVEVHVLALQSQVTIFRGRWQQAAIALAVVGAYAAACC